MKTKLSKIVFRTLRQAYREAVLKIKKEIIDTNIPSNKIDIISEFSRSQKTLGEYVTLDYEHRLTIRTLIKDITDYQIDTNLKRPLNFMMIAEPGSGKSHFIDCLSKEMSRKGIQAITYNMAALQNLDDLIQPLESIRNLKVADKLPILFLDEFDSLERNYSLLLPLMWDGELHISHRYLKLGKVIIIIAGSDTNINKVMSAAKSMQKNIALPLGTPKKIVDLLSRINGGVIDIPNLDLMKGDRDRRVDKVLLVISLLRKRFGPELVMVPWALLKFVALTKFRYGVRSITHLVELINVDIKDKNKLELSELKLPLNDLRTLSSNSLAYHLYSDDEVEDIINLWNSVSRYPDLVRFVEDPIEEEL